MSKTKPKTTKNPTNEIASLIKEVEKKFGKEALLLLNSDIQTQINVTPSGSFIIDTITGIGGYPEGRIVEIYGPESSGKTTLALHAINEAQKLDKICAFIDVEHSLDPNYAQALGVDINKLIVSQPDSGEQALEIVDTLIKTNKVKMIVLDSVAALVPQAELYGEMTESSIGLQARLMSKALRKITGSINKSNCTVLFINQLREKVKVMFGNPEITPGGRALKFYASLRLEVRRIRQIGAGNDIQGNEIKIKVVKNKLAPPYKVGETKIIFSRGISQEAEILQLAEELGIIKRSGAYFNFDGENFARGRATAEDYLEEHHEFFLNIQELVKEKLTKK